IDGDGYDDLIVGAYRGDDGGTNAGEAYIIFGQADIGQDVVQGTAADDALVGTANVDILIGGRGADSFADIGTGDVVRGGEGDDVITLTATDFDDINGGTGMDTLALAGTGMDLDLTTFLPGDLKSIEMVDLTGTGDNTLTITEQTLFDVSDWRMDGEAWMIVKGDAGDAITSTGFTANGTYDYGGVTYDLYESGGANLLVDQGIGAAAASFAPIAAPAEDYGLLSTSAATDLDSPTQDVAVLSSFSSALDATGSSDTTSDEGAQPAYTLDEGINQALLDVTDITHSDDIVS
ncbi:hypothetical protein GRI39_14215, partial [Altererythrobacter indicus]|nr:hypothetical protein [Altericroceibacterium indicum]